MTNDPQPKGYLTLLSAFETFSEGWQRGGELSASDSDNLLKRFQAALIEDEIRASVFFPNKEGIFEVAPALWSVPGFPELEILHRDVPATAPSEWRAYTGRTLFVEEEIFERWLRRNQPAPPPDAKDFEDPSEVVKWTLVMSCAWIETRSFDAVRWQMDDWRRAHGWPDASLGLLAIGNQLGDDDDDSPAFFDSKSAFSQLRRKLEGGELQATGQSSLTRQWAALDPNDWTYGSLELDGEIRDLWRVAPIAYTNIKVLRRDILGFWPPVSDRDAVSMELPRQDDAPLNIGELTPDQRRIFHAVQNLWPEGVPPMRVTARNELINNKVGKPPVSPRSLQKFFNQVLPRLSYARQKSARIGKQA